MFHGILGIHGNLIKKKKKFKLSKISVTGALPLSQELQNFRLLNSEISGLLATHLISTGKKTVTKVSDADLDNLVGV